MSSLVDYHPHIKKIKYSSLEKQSKQSSVNVHFILNWRESCGSQEDTEKKTMGFEGLQLHRAPWYSQRRAKAGWAFMMSPPESAKQGSQGGKALSLPLAGTPSALAGSFLVEVQEGRKHLPS